MDSIAEKLAKGCLPFFVCGNEKRLGLVATEYTLDSQVENNDLVKALRGKYLCWENAVKVLAESLKVREEASFEDKAWKRKRSKRANELFKPSQSSERKEWLKRDGWAMLWKAYIRHKYALLYQLLRRSWRLSQKTGLELLQLRDKTRLEVIRSARAVLCTIATASRKLADEEVI